LLYRSNPTHRTPRSARRQRADDPHAPKPMTITSVSNASIRVMLILVSLRL
jgi:hypothetical protein